MAIRTAIEWTDATWNPVSGCTKLSRGCDNCYAERLAERFRGTLGHPIEHGFDLMVRPHKLPNRSHGANPPDVGVYAARYLRRRSLPAR